MKKNQKILIITFFCIICTGCKAEYTLTYKNNNFDEEVIFTEINNSETELFNRYYEESPYLKYDDNNYYNFYEDPTKKRIYYNIGPKLEKTNLLKYCFEDIYIIDKDDYLDIETGGENYCDNYNLKITFKTDKYVYDTNANKIDNATYTWNNLNDGIKLLVSKTQKIESVSIEESKDNNLTTKIIILISVIIIFIASMIFIKKKK